MRAKTLILVLSAALMVGCESVPQTEVMVNFKTGVVSIKSPKEIDATNFVAKVGTNGTVEFSMGSYSSHNSPDVMGIVAQANTRQIIEAISFARSLAELGLRTASPIPLPAASAPQQTPVPAVGRWVPAF